MNQRKYFQLINKIFLFHSDDADATGEIPQIFSDVGITATQPKMKQISQRLDSFTSSHSADYNDDAAGDMKYFLNHFSKLFHCREWIQV